jgi:hypothetical protein
MIRMWDTPLLRRVLPQSGDPALGIAARFGFIQAAVLTIAVSRWIPRCWTNMRAALSGGTFHALYAWRLVAGNALPAC